MNLRSLSVFALAMMMKNHFGDIIASKNGVKYDTLIKFA